MTASADEPRGEDAKGQQTTPRSLWYERAMDAEAGLTRCREALRANSSMASDEASSDLTVGNALRAIVAAHDDWRAACENDAAACETHGMAWRCGDALTERVDMWRAIVAAATPLPMILHCPACGAQHVDAPEPERGWTNPPHRSHLCHGCGIVWRPADVPTTGVATIFTRGSTDTWPSAETEAKPKPSNDPPAAGVPPHEERPRPESSGASSPPAPPADAEATGEVK